jgi:hypothetical protein
LRSCACTRTAACFTVAVDVGTQKLARQTKARHRAAQRQDLLPGARPEGDAVSDGCHLQWPQGARFVPVGVRLSQPGLPHLLDQNAPAREHLQQQAQRDRQRQHPLAHRHTGDDVVDQVRRRLCHAPRAARGAKAAPFAAEGQQLVVPALPAAQAQEPVGQDAARQEGVELVTDELRQPGTCGLCGLGEETLGMLLHQAVQRGLLGAVALVVDRGAIAMRPPGVVSVGLHALGMGNLGWCSFSGRAGQCIRLWGDHQLPVPRRWPRSGAAPCPGAPPPAMR